MKKLIYLLIVLVIIFGGYYWWQKPAQAPVATPAPVATSTNSEVSTADWKTYKNNKYGFEFQYPPTWNLEIDPDGVNFWLMPSDQKVPDLGSDQTGDDLHFNLGEYNTDKNVLCKNSDWDGGAGFSDSKTVCLSRGRSIWMTSISSESRVIEESILATLKFTK